MKPTARYIPIEPRTWIEPLPGRADYKAHIQAADTRPRDSAMHSHARSTADDGGPHCYHGLCGALLGRTFGPRADRKPRAVTVGPTSVADPCPNCLTVLMQITTVRKVEGDGGMGGRLRQLRAAAGLTQAEVADKMKNEEGIESIYPQTIVRLEAGTRSLKFVEAAALSRILHFSLDELSMATRHTERTPSGPPQPPERRASRIPDLTRPHSAWSPSAGR